MGKKAAASKKVPAAPLGGGKAEKSAKKNPLFEKKARNFRIGGDVMPKRDITRFVKWPKAYRLQRQKRIMVQRLKVPPTLAQFQATLDKNQFEQLARLLKKVAPETKAQKKQRLAGMAEKAVKGKDSDSKAPPVVKYGLNHVTTLVEEKKAKLVVIAHDVDPAEIICWLPALCRKKDVPFCIVKSKSRLGKFVHKKTASCLALTSVGKDDMKTLETLAGNFKAQFNDNVELRRKWGGGIMGVKSNHVIAYRQKLIERENAKKLNIKV
jgi:large subunit ribosomal protein L7Ae